MDDSNIETAEDAARLDRLLALAPTPAVPAALERRILADFERVRRHANQQSISARWTFAKFMHRAASSVWPDAPLWQPAAAFGLALLIGTGVAAFAPLDVPQQDDASANVFALDSAPDVDAGQGI